MTILLGTMNHTTMSMSNTTFCLYRVDIPNLVSNRTLLVLWLVSNCGSQHRNKYVRELQRYIHVDIYGKCGSPDPCTSRGGECMRRLKQKVSSMRRLKQKVDI